MQQHSLNYLARATESAIETVSYAALVVLAVVLVVWAANELRSYVERRVAQSRHRSRRSPRSRSAQSGGSFAGRV